MENVALRKDYLIYRKNQETVFCSGNLRAEKFYELSYGYLLKRCSYGGNVDGYTLHATENTLMDRTGKVLYIYRNINDSSELCKIICHRDGTDYMVFRTDLYGYSVLNMSTLQDFHFIPSGSFPAGETFIWTDVFYNPENNVLAVSGCFWACPFGTFLQDFTHPLEAPEVWADVQEHLENGYDRFDDVDFVSWEGTGLVLKAIDSNTEERVNICLSEQQYYPWLKAN